ncbi:MAG: phosphoenolpyruvate--protein phosphotransferase [Oscillospiraceae bacterium]|jgi:phosphotransferase system enzyme I (PtsI)|nr:phosphoenolpyruvate--protein phosphotransferase [Oscillospiraceae bacterium]
MEYSGKGVSKGVAIGRIHYISQVMDKVEKRTVEDTQNEVKRFEGARALAATQLGELAVTTAKKLGKKNSLLFEIHQMMLEDLDYREAVRAKIRTENACAEWAVSETAGEFSRDFAQMDDEYMQARAADVLDVSRRVVEILLGKQPRQNTFDDPVILAAGDFAPSETAQLERETTLALLTAGGSANSHTAIFARTMGIPAVIGLGDTLNESWDGRQCALDGETGRVILDPTEAEIEAIRQKQRQQEAYKQELEKYRGRESKTRQGKGIKLFANIGNVQDADLAMTNDAEGVGLFRSEFLYLESKDYPSEDTQFEAYKAVAQVMQNRLVIIRTLDIGADKQAAYFNLPAEENPAMGLRALRICLQRPEVFKTQLRAIYRASAFGRVAVMLPMVTSLWEVRRAKELAAEVREQLDGQGVAYDRAMPVGIMVETPAAAVISDLLAKEVDFFSIGTNDLTQYTLAVDRQNQSLDAFCDTHHEAVLRLIQTTVNNAHAAGIWCGICGELGADEELTARFIEMGVDELSVTPPAVLPLRKRVCEL